MFVEAKTSVTSLFRKTEDFTVKIRVHQGSAFNSYLLSLIIDKLTISVRYDAPWCMVFARNVV